MALYRICSFKKVTYLYEEKVLEKSGLKTKPRVKLIDKDQLFVD